MRLMHNNGERALQHADFRWHEKTITITEDASFILICKTKGDKAISPMVRSTVAATAFMGRCVESGATFTTILL